jgi:hypothetical protein
MGVKITDTTMRDGHQSLLATRMRTLLCHSERQVLRQKDESEESRRLAYPLAFAIQPSLGGHLP